MKKKKDKKKQPIRSAAENDARERAKDFLLRFLILLGATFAFLTIYYLGDYFNLAATFWVYFVALALSLVAYVAWNRGFARARATREMLPDDWSEEEKDRFFDEAKKWREDSKILLYVIIPLVFTFFVDAVKMFFVDRLF